MRTRIVLFASLWLAMAYLAASCGPPGPNTVDEQLAATSAYQTLVALGVIQPDGGPMPTKTRQPTQSDEDLEPIPTSTRTPSPTPTQDQDDCEDMATYGDDIDVTIPDDTEVAPGEVLAKVWRIRNGGTCTWNTSYQLVFSNGDQMGGPAIQSFPGTVAPGTRVDLSMEITAPTTPGTYQGFWRIRDPQGQFVRGQTGSIVTLWVKIVVSTNPPPPNVIDMSLYLAGPLSGYVLSDGSTGAPENVGDTPGGLSMQGFMTWIISAIPSGSAIHEVVVDFSDFNILGSPFSDLQCLRAYRQDYESLDSSDYMSGPVAGAIARWCQASDLLTPLVSNGFLQAIQEKIGSDRFQIRLQFSSLASDGDDEADLVRFGTPILRVKYTEP